MLREAAHWLRAGARGGRWRRALLPVAGLLLLLLAALRPRAPAETRLAETFPSIAPIALAHYLADFSNYASMFPQLESWTIEEEWSNYTSWSYVVSYSCGAHCVGRAALSAHAAHAAAPRHAAATTHRLLARDSRCSRLPGLPWPVLCEETETETLIEDARSGARLQEITRGTCGALTALLASCARAEDLKTARHQHLRALRIALATDTAYVRR